jgi:small-conductance mechanosensitive channel
VEVGVSYSSDLDTVLKALNEIAEESDDVLDVPRHEVQLRNFGESTWDMKLMVWIPDVKKRYQVLNKLNQAIVRKFAEYEIEIPFPQRDLHVRSGLHKERGENQEKHGSEDSDTAENNPNTD